MGEQVLSGNSVLMKEQSVALSNEVNTTLPARSQKEKHRHLSLTETNLRHHRNHGQDQNESREAVLDLKKWGYRRIMSTGDKQVAQRLLGPSWNRRIHAELLPLGQGLLTLSSCLLGTKDCHVGDGVNECSSPALANVDWDGAGTDIASRGGMCL